MTTLNNQYLVANVLIYTMLMILLSELQKERVIYGSPVTRIKTLKDVL